MYWVDFFLCFYLGFFGIHKFKEKRYGLGVLYLCTFGLFTIGWLVDCIKLFIVAAKKSLEARDNKRVFSQNGEFANVNSYCISCSKYLAEPTNVCPYCGTVQVTDNTSLIKNVWFWVAILGAVFNTTFVFAATSGDEVPADSNTPTEIVETTNVPEWATGLAPELALEIELAFTEIGENPENIQTFEYVETKNTALFTNHHYRVTFYFPWKNTKSYRVVTEDWFEGEPEKALYPYGYVRSIEFWTDDDTSSTCYWSHYSGGEYQNSNPSDIGNENIGIAETSYKVAALELAAEINSNKEKSGQKYNGQQIEITGTISDISDGGTMMGYYVHGKRGDSGLRIICWVDKTADPDLGIGDNVVFEGILREVSTVNATEIAFCKIK